MARTATVGTALRTFPRECFRGFIGSFPGFNRALRICAICAVTWAGAGCSAGYILRAGWEEARILTNRRPIQAVLRDTTVDALTRDKLRLVLDVRDFAVRDLGLRAGNSYRDFTELDRDTLALQVMAAAELDLTWKMWNFPIVGALPYKAWFDFDRALAEAEALRREGWDVRVSPVSAFSTLGWFPDPILSPTLRAASVSLANPGPPRVSVATVSKTRNARAAVTTRTKSVVGPSNGQVTVQNRSQPGRTPSISAAS